MRDFMFKRKGKVCLLGRFIAMVMTIVLCVTVMPIETKAAEVNYAIIFQNIADPNLVDILKDYYYFLDLTHNKIYNFEKETENKIVVRNPPLNIEYKIMSKDGIVHGALGTFTANTKRYCRLTTIYFYDGSSLVDTKYMLGSNYVQEQYVTKPKKDGYVFSGWVRANGNPVEFPFWVGYDGIVDLGNSVGLYASWETHDHNWDVDNWENNNEAHWHECLTDKCPIEENAEKDGYALHEMGQWTNVAEATFNENGLKTRECKTCDYTEEEVIPKLLDSHIHDFNGREEVVKEPKCYETGSKKVYCTLEECGAYEEQIIEKIPHDYEEELRYDNVIHYHKCKNCDDFVDNENHQITDWMIIQEPSWDEDGLKGRECETCDYREEQRIPKLSEEHNHDFSGETEIVRETKCYEEGLEYVYCILEGCEAYEERSIEKTSHDYEDKWRYSDVIHFHKCKNCENISDEELHQMTAWQLVDIQTYAIRELEERHCIKCEYSEERIAEKSEPEHKHEYIGREKVVTESTCSQEGVKYIYCNGDMCESFIQENIPKVNHDYEVGWFYNEDIHYHKCKNCEHHIDDEEHNMVETNMVKLATKDSPGIMEVECVRCGYIEYEEVPYDNPKDDSNNDSSDNNPNELVGSKPSGDAGNEGELPPFTAPQTGDMKVVHIYATVAMIAGMTYLLVYFKPIDVSMTEEAKKKLVDSLIEWAKNRNGIMKGIAILGISVVLFYYHFMANLYKRRNSVVKTKKILQ